VDLVRMRPGPASAVFAGSVPPGTLGRWPLSVPVAWICRRLSRPGPLVVRSRARCLRRLRAAGSIGRWPPRLDRARAMDLPEVPGGFLFADFAWEEDSEEETDI